MVELGFSRALYPAATFLRAPAPYLPKEKFAHRQAGQRNGSARLCLIT
jgi:hypothetical protein